MRRPVFVCASFRVASPESDAVWCDRICIDRAAHSSRRLTSTSDRPHNSTQCQSYSAASNLNRTSSEHPPFVVMSDLLTQALVSIVIVLIAALFALLLQRNQPQQQQQQQSHSLSPQSQDKSEIRELQQTVRLLIETQARQSISSLQAAPASPFPASASASNSLNNESLSPPPATHSRRNSDQDEFGSSNNLAALGGANGATNARNASHNRPDYPDYVSQSAVNDSLRHKRLIRKVSQTQQRLQPSNSVVSVPLHVYQEVKELTDAVKSLERRNRELNRQLTLNEVSNVVDVEQKYKVGHVLRDEGGKLWERRASDGGMLSVDAANSLINHKSHQQGGALSPSGGGSSQPKRVALTASEIETIRAIFNMFGQFKFDLIANESRSTQHCMLMHSRSNFESTSTDILLACCYSLSLSLLPHIKQTRRMQARFPSKRSQRCTPSWASL